MYCFINQELLLRVGIGYLNNIDMKLWDAMDMLWYYNSSSRKNEELFHGIQLKLITLFLLKMYSSGWSTNKPKGTKRFCLLKDNIVAINIA